MALNAPVLQSPGGQNYLARAHAGERLKITTVVMSDDVTNLPGDKITGTANPVITFSPVQKFVSGPLLRLRVDYTNSGLTQPFNFRVGAVYAGFEDDDGNITGEIIYAAGNAREAASVIQPPPTPDLKVTFFWDINVTIDNAPNVTVVIDEGVAYVRTMDRATDEDFEKGSEGPWADSEGVHNYVGQTKNEILNTIENLDLDHYVKKVDKATPADLATGTPDKWPDTKLLKEDQTRQDMERANLETRVALLEEGNSGELANEWSIYMTDLDGIIYFSAGDFVYNSQLSRLEC